MPRSVPVRPRRGVTLLEVLLAAAVLTVMVVPMVGMFRVGNRFALGSERELEATLFAHAEVERLRGTMDASAARTTGRVAVPARSGTTPDGYEYRSSIVQVEPGLVRVTVTVRWKTGKVKREVELATLVSRAPNSKVERKRGGRSSSFGSAFRGALRRMGR